MLIRGSVGAFDIVPTGHYHFFAPMPTLKEKVEKADVEASLRSTREILDNAEDVRFHLELLQAARIFAEWANFSDSQRRWICFREVEQLTVDQLNTLIRHLQDVFQSLDRHDEFQAWVDAGSILTYAITLRARRS